MSCLYQGMYTCTLYSVQGQLVKVIARLSVTVNLGLSSIVFFMGNGSVDNSTYVRVNIMFITRHLQDKCLFFCIAYQGQWQGQNYISMYMGTLSG
jgi:hypothetical protein